MTDNGQPTDGKRNISEELEVAGNQLVDRVKELIEEGNVRKVIIRNPDGRTLLEIPLTIGVVAGGALFAFYPIIAAVGALAALVARVTIEVVREEPDATIQDVKEGVEEAADSVKKAAKEVKNKLSDE
jgi:hypothetical protein